MRRLDAQGNLLSSSGGTLYGTHAAIPAASTVEPGTIYFETDTGVGYRSDGTYWVAVVQPGAGGQLDYAQITADKAFAVTTEATAVAIITGNSVSYDGTKVRIEAWCPYVAGSAGGIYVGVLLRDTAVLGQFRMSNGTTAFGVGVIFYDTPAAGAHTYKWSGFGNVGGGIAKAGPVGSGNNLPAFLRVTKA